MFDPDFDLDWERDLERNEFRKPRHFACSDGLCGMEDCVKCRPWFDSERYDEIIDLLN